MWPFPESHVYSGKISLMRETTSEKYVIFIVTDAWLYHIITRYHLSQFRCGSQSIQTERLFHSNSNTIIFIRPKLVFSTSHHLHKLWFCPNDFCDWARKPSKNEVEHRRKGRNKESPRSCATSTYVCVHRWGECMWTMCRWDADIIIIRSRFQLLYIQINLNVISSQVVVALPCTASYPDVVNFSHPIR